ncbi:hypothetical protein N658DRAFT_255493 [Parathielavia hyrcaniae]|uniref:Uncharacterized protein n=1 Tax=Parathielavia hyrcaniae TaxID=113614 RepID=A0AAN6PU55_9PEZI|nr:hypothetical protein N658DRAFT_255493 [Parathielavia hyrcaniae]
MGCPWWLMSWESRWLLGWRAWFPSPAAYPSSPGSPPGLPVHFHSSALQAPRPICGTPKSAPIANCKVQAANGPTIPRAASQCNSFSSKPVWLKHSVSRNVNLGMMTDERLLGFVGGGAWPYRVGGVISLLAWRLGGGGKETTERGRYRYAKRLQAATEAR